MSGYDLRQRALVAFEHKINEWRGLLEESTHADLATLRGYQGNIAGLKEAAAILNDTFMDLSG